MSLPGFATYGASKAGLTHFTAGLAADLRGTGVGVTVVEAGPVRSEFLDSVTSAPTIERSYNRLYKTRAGARPSIPEDVAKALVRAVEKGKRNVWLPRSAALAPALVELPRRVVGLAVADIRHPTPPG